MRVCLRAGGLLLVGCAALMAACGSDEGGGGEGVADTGALPDAAQDAAGGGEDTAASDVEADVEADAPSGVDPCAARLEWTAGAELPTPRDHHGTVIYTRADGRAILQVQGGTNYNTIFSDVWEAELQDDGTLAAWEQGAALPGVRAGHAVVHEGEHLFLLGGRELSGFLATTLRPTWGEAGRVDGWEAQAPLPEARFHASASSDGSHVWLTGGLNSEDNEAQNTVYVAPILEDGALGEWRLQGRMFDPRSHHASFVRDGRLYLAYGFKGNPIGSQTEELTDVIAAPILEGGELGEWERILRDDLAISTLGVTALEGCAFMTGGLVRGGPSDYTYNNQLWRLDFGADGAPTRTPVDGALSVGRSHLHQSPFHDGRLYVVGGSRGLQSVTPLVEIGTFVTP